MPSRFPDTTPPTPATANSAPSAASICGRIAAQPTASIVWRASFTACTGESRSIASATANATSVPSTSEISVTLFCSTNGTSFNANVPISVTTGISSAGRNNLLPKRCASVSRRTAAASPASSDLPRPSLPEPAITASAIARQPVTKCGSSAPNRNVSA